MHEGIDVICRPYSSDEILDLGLDMMHDLAGFCAEV